MGQKFSTEGNSRFQELKRLWVENAMKASGRTQTDVAGAMGISPANLSALVNGHKAITDATMDKVADALNLMLPDLGVKANLPSDAKPARTDRTDELVEKVFHGQEETNRLIRLMADRMLAKR